MSWIQAAPAVLVAVAVATLPGLPAAWALRFRGLALVAASIAASFAIIAIVSITLPFIGVAWGILPVLIAAVALGALCLLVRRFTGQLPPWAHRSVSTRLATAAAVLLTAALIAWKIRGAIHDPASISQTYDGVFHLNAVAHILATGDASPLHMNISAPMQETVFYPTVWHATVALVAQISGAGVPVATNAVVITVSAWVWPVAILFFSRPFVARRPVHLIATALLAGCFTAFPFLLIAWGVLYPNLLSTALIPIALGFLYPALRHRTTGGHAPVASYWIAAIGATGATTLAQPNGLFGIAAFTLPMFAVVANDVRRSGLPTRTKLLRWGGIGAVIAAYAVMWFAVSTGDNSRGYEGNVVSAFVSAVTNAPLIDARSWFLTVLVGGGIVALIVARRHRWLIGSYIIAVGLYTIASGFGGPVRDLFTGAWYNDAHRLASLLPIAAVPLAALAAAWLLDFVTDGLRRIEPARVGAFVHRCLPAVGAVVVCALLLTGARGQQMVIQLGWIEDLYQSENGQLLSENERTLLERVDEEVPADALLAGDPWTGTGLAAAISGREVLFPHLNGNYSAEASELGTDFIELGAGACTLLEDLGIDYMLDFGPQRYDIGEPESQRAFDGLRGLDESPVLDEVDREGYAALYRVDC